MFIQQKLIISSVLTLCMLTVSFLLSSLTIIQNSKTSEMAGSNSAQTTASALLIDSTPKSCENDNLPENETCLYINAAHSVSDDAKTGRENAVAMDTSDQLRKEVTTVAITIPEPTTKPSKPIITAVIESDQEPTSNPSNHALEEAIELACETITHQLLTKTESNGVEEESGMLNGVCMELYRDNGDEIANPRDDQFIGFSLVMDDYGHNPAHYQFTSLPPGTYFAKYYPMAYESMALSLAE